MGEIGHSWISLVNWYVQILSVLSIFEGLTHYSSYGWASHFFALPQASTSPVDIQHYLCSLCFAPNTLIFSCAHSPRVHFRICFVSLWLCVYGYACVYVETHINYKPQNHGGFSLRQVCVTPLSRLLERRAFLKVCLCSCPSNLYFQLCVCGLKFSFHVSVFVLSDVCCSLLLHRVAFSCSDIYLSNRSN